jgi:hypothetical protein
MDESDDAPTTTPRTGGRPALSRLAMASAAMGGVSLPLVCCGAGLSGAFAILLGMMALDRIKSSGGALRGRAVAWSGIVTGLLTVVLSVIWLSAVADLQTEWDRQFADGVRKTFDARDEQTSLEALRCWSAASSESVSAREILAFAGGVRERLGAFDSMSVNSKDVAPDLLGNHMVSYVVNFDFASGRRSGMVTGRLRTSSEAWAPTLQIASILLNEPDAPDGVLVFPRPSAAKGSAKDAAKDAGADGVKDGAKDAVKDGDAEGSASQAEGTTQEVAK